MRVQEPVADRGGQLPAMIALDQRHHHVERRDAARAGDAVAVDLEQRRHHGDVGEGLAERRQVLPVERRAALVEQSGACEDVRARRKCRRGSCLCAQAAAARRRSLLSSKRRGISAGADEAPCRRAGRVPVPQSAMMATPFEAVTGSAVGAGMPPAIERLAGQQIGRAQRLDGRGVGHQREARHQQKADRRWHRSSGYAVMAQNVK